MPFEEKKDAAVEKTEMNLPAGLFFASPFWRKLQNIFGGCCSSKMEEVAATHYGHGRGAGHPQGHHVRSLYYQPKFPSRKLFSVSSPQRQDEGIPALSR